MLFSKSKPRQPRVVHVPLWMIAVCMLLLAVVPSITAVAVSSMIHQQPVVVVYKTPTSSHPAGYTPLHDPARTADTLAYNPRTESYALTGPTRLVPGLIPDWLKPENMINSLIRILTKSLTGTDLPLKVPRNVKQQSPPPLFTAIMSWLSHTPDFTASVRGAQFVAGLQVAAFGMLVLAIAVVGMRYMSGAENNLLGALSGLAVVALGIGFYPDLWHLGIQTVNLFGDGIYQLGLQLRGWSNPATAAVPGGLALRALLVILEFIALIIIGIVRAITILVLGIAFLAGPIAVAARGFGPNPVWTMWINNVLRACLWPLVWSLTAAVFVLFTGGTSFIPSAAEALFQPLLQIALVFFMIRTPSIVNAGFAMAQPRMSAGVNTVGMAASRSLVARGAVSGGLAVNPGVAVGLAMLGVSAQNIQNLAKSKGNS